MRVRIIVLAGVAAVVVAATGTFAVIAATAASPPDLGPAVIAPAGQVVTGPGEAGAPPAVVPPRLAGHDDDVDDDPDDADDHFDLDD
ncbi:hypothetical protein [Amycolatopsis sp. EV170708-02-1]|uniref:hypothetical protein n=1 Tax=Amycolatopsis sp. EV170708-02-1 TaxID=2919322 RepID=UPI001F0BFB99|nr:hypothetical protein [Amycolatopsis sp. EV170708-02-1]UMP07129.1 hypothetical protein MJQ72_20945 [Amycolatopsis sp. EV170708-02-1]